jgi:hypothetical protein
MGLFNFNRQKETTPIEIPKNTSDNVDSVMTLAIQTSLPKISESRNGDWVDYGRDNDYPTDLELYYSNSPTHQAIVDTKALVVAGDGYTYDDSRLSESQKTQLNQLMYYIDGKNDIESFINDLSKDFELYGAMCIELIWSLDFTRIVKVTRISPKHIRSGTFEDGRVNEYFYSRDWSNRKEERVEIAAFDITNKEDARQLMYIPVQMVLNEYYGEPQYLAGLNWIDLEAQTGLYYKSLLDNGFNPSVVVKFYRRPNSQEERDDIVSGLKKSFGGVKNSGKAVVMFSDGKELAPDIDPIDVSNIDKQFTVIADQITTKILTAHRVTTPELFGIAIPGKLGSADFATQVEAFQKFVITPNQKVLNNTINKILRINGLDVNFKITPFELTANSTPKA